MTDVGQAGGARRVARFERVRWVVVVALLAVAALGVAAGRGPVAIGGALGSGGFAFRVAVGGYLLLVVLAPLTVAALVRRYRKGRSDTEGEPVLTSLVLVPAVGLLVLAGIAVALLSSLFGQDSGPAVPLPSRTPSGAGGIGHRADLSFWPTLAVALLALAVAVVAGLLLRPRRDAATPVGESPPDATRAALREAARAGGAAFDATDDPRGAVLACYRAMEEALVAGPAAPAAADTPAEVLDRAVAAGLLRGPGGPALVALFAEARYSGHEFGAAQRAAARDALHAVRAELGEQP